MIPESFIQDLLAKVDIVEMIDGMVKLKKAGGNYTACCPFHSEKTPSFSVSPTKQFYHCFGCGANGSAIGFLMEYQGIGFVDAVKELAGRVGMEVPDERAAQPVQQGGEGLFASRVEPSKARSLVDVMAKAAAYYHDRLLHSPRGVEYCKKRGITSETAKRFGIGYAPDDWTALKAIFPEYNSGQLAEAGLVIDRDTGKRYDRFRDRLMIPIINQKGEVIAFGGRILDHGEPKYLNSPETPIFEKGKELFGLPQARQALREKNEVIVTEGYMDVIALYQNGIENAVATLGTATTAMHVQKLLRQADRIVFCFDGDAAGKKAAARAMENALEALPDNKILSFAFLPDGHDPDSFIQEKGKEVFDELIAKAMPLSDFMIHDLSQKSDLTTAEGKSKLVSSAKPLLQKMQAPLLRIQLVKRLAEASGLTQEEVERICELRQITFSAASKKQNIGGQQISMARRMLRLIIQKPLLAKRVGENNIPDGDERKALLLLIKLASGLPEGAQYASIRESLRGHPEESIIESCAADLLDLAMEEDEVEAEFESIVQRISSRGIRAEYDALARKLKTEGLSNEEKARYVQLLVEMKQ